MRKCPRCHSSMIVDYDAVHEGYTPVWKCLGCGRSIYLDAARQAEDEQIRRRIAKSMGEQSVIEGS